MEQENVPLEAKVQNQFTQVTFLSKYLAMVLFIALPFIGGWVGYMYAPEKVVEVEKVVYINSKNIQQEEAVSQINLKPFLSDARYQTDGTTVYMFDDLDPFDEIEEIEKFIVEGADPDTFEPCIVRLFPISQGNTFQEWISRDKNSVYFQYKKIEGADPSTFVITDEVPVNKDADDVFLHFKIIPSADPKTYEVVFNTGGGNSGNIFGKDSNSCYFNYTSIDCVSMPSSLEDALNFEL